MTILRISSYCGKDIVSLISLLGVKPKSLRKNF